MTGLHVIVGLGVTGLACVRYLKAQQLPIVIVDSRPHPPQLDLLQLEYPDIPVFLGPFHSSSFVNAECVVLSPGISLQEKVIQEQIQRGVPVIGDIELFARVVRAPVIAITGTNAKSTVTTLVGKMALSSGLKTSMGGNLGIPALDLLMNNPEANVFVLELSSFQLETTFSLQTKVASILNITPDHMDRYPDFLSYQVAKHRIYKHCQIAVCNDDDPLTDCREHGRKLFFSLNAPRKDCFGLVTTGDHVYLAFQDECLLAVEEIPVKGKHYYANALAALAIGHAFGLPMNVMLESLREFKGLTHRCQFVRERYGVLWYNDSKGTNVGATLAAIEGLGSEVPGKLVLIAGGLGKNADFSLLLPVIEKYVRHVVLMGQAAKEIAAVIDERIPVSFAGSMEEAVAQADSEAKPQDYVLLSPACASYDMFKHFEHRGEVFMDIVRELR